MYQSYSFELIEDFSVLDWVYCYSPKFFVTSKCYIIEKLVELNEDK